MESLEISARSVEEAIQLALEQLGIGRDEVKVTILREGKSGILGLGAEDAIIKVEPFVSVSEQASDVNDVTEAAKGILEKLLAMMGVAGSVVSQAQPVVGGEGSVVASVALDVNGDDLGILIGRRGQTLSSLQYIVRLIVGHQTGNWVPIVIDVEGYKERRYRALQALAWRIAEQVKANRRQFVLEPMPANERRIIHLALAEYHDVITESTGEGEARKVVIRPKKR